MKLFKSTVSLLVAIVLLVITTSCSKADTIGSAQKETDSSTSSDKVELSLQDELKWMDFTRIAYGFQKFNRNDELNEKALINDLLMYFVFEYKEPDRDKLISQSEDFMVIKKDVIDMLSEKIFGRKIKQHQSVDWIRYEGENYYIGATDNHGGKRTYIKSFTDNKNGTATIEYDFYYADEDDFDNPVFDFTPEEFANEMKKSPQQFGKPNASGKLTLKKVVDNGVERYIIIENINTPM